MPAGDAPVFLRLGSRCLRKGEEEEEGDEGMEGGRVRASHVPGGRGTEFRAVRENFLEVAARLESTQSAQRRMGVTWGAAPGL